MAYYTVVQVFFTFLFLQLSHAWNILVFIKSARESSHVYMSEHDDLAQALGHPPERVGCLG